MSRFDLSEAADFNRITAATVTNLAGLFGLQANEWDLVEGSYKGGTQGATKAIFHVFKSKTDYEGALSRVSDYGGRRIVKYQFPYKDGQTTDDLGRRPNSFEMDILIFGPNYMNGFRQLQQQLNDPVPGVLVHPIRGEIVCKADEFTFTHECSQRKAVGIHITFVEHNFTVGDIRQVDSSSLKKALAATLEIFGIIDTVFAKVEGALLLTRGLKNLLKTYLGTYKQDNALVASQINTTFNSKGSSNDIPSLLPVNLGGTGTATSDSGRLASGSTRTGSRSLPSVASQDQFIVVRSVSDPFNGVPVLDLAPSTVQAIAVQQLTKNVQALRDQAATIIQTINNATAAPARGVAPGASPALELFDAVDSIRQTALIMQKALETGVATSNVAIIDYTTPRLMSLREVAFANAIDPERVRELDILNPSLLSVNYIEKGTVLKVPIS